METDERKKKEEEEEEPILDTKVTTNEEDEGLAPPKQKKPKKIKDKEKIRQRKRERRNKQSSEHDNTTDQQQQQQEQQQQELSTNPFKLYIEGEKSTKDFRTLIESNRIFHDFFAANIEDATYLKIPVIRNFLKWLFIPEEFSNQNSNFKWKYTTPPKFSRVILIAGNSFPTYLTEGIPDLFIKSQFQSSCNLMSPGDKIRIYPTMDTLFLDSSKQQQQSQQQPQIQPIKTVQIQPENLLEEGKPWWNHADSLLLSEIQLSEMGYPVASVEDGILETQPAETLPLDANREILGLDCEMCQTEKGLEVTRISIVDANFVKIYDEFVLPRHPVIDYLTQYSGITEQTLQNVKKSFAEAQKDVLSLVRAETILVGHSLDNDLRKLEIAHKRVVDTVALYPHRNGGQSKNKLSWIAELFLNKKIHTSDSSHDSTEDAEVALELVKYRLTVGEAYIYSKIGVNMNPTTVPDNSIIAKMSNVGVKIAFSDIPNSLQHFSGTECTDTIKPMPGRSDEERLKNTISAITEDNFGFIFTRFYSVTQSYNELERVTAVKDEEAIKRHLKDVHEAVKKVDGYVKEICDAVPKTGKNLIMFVGLQGTNKSLWDMRATTKRNSPADWTKEKEEFLLEESSKAKNTFLNLMIK